MKTIEHSQRETACPKVTTRKPNTAKGKAYALAYGMINTALENGCPLQAITIEESLLTDRQSSTLNAHNASKTPFMTLNRALSEWKRQKARGESLFDDEMNGLLPQLEEWWDERNALLHGIAKSPCGQGPDIPAEEFVARAEKAAKEGVKLARKVSRWTQKQVAKARKVQ
jgi:hypothetical protein